MRIDDDGIVEPGSISSLLELGAPPRLRLLHPGSEPRAELRHDFDSAQAGQLEMAMELRLTMTSGGTALPTATLPKMVMTFDVAAVPSSDHRARMTSILRTTRVRPTADTPPALAETLTQGLKLLDGLRTRFSADERGYVYDSEILPPASLPSDMQSTIDQVRQSVDALATPLLAEPLGVGATWDSLRRLNAGGVDSLQLVEGVHEGDHGKVSVQSCPRASLVTVETDLLFHVLVIALDVPSRFCKGRDRPAARPCARGLPRDRANRRARGSFRRAFGARGRGAPAHPHRCVDRGANP